ncbi:unnamed protein product, partial [Polarella glacialis]
LKCRPPAARGLAEATMPSRRSSPPGDVVDAGGRPRLRKRCLRQRQVLASLRPFRGQLLPGRCFAARSPWRPRAQASGLASPLPATWDALASLGCLLAKISQEDALASLGCLLAKISQEDALASLGCLLAKISQEDALASLGCLLAKISQEDALASLGCLLAKISQEISHRPSFALAFFMAFCMAFFTRAEALAFFVFVAFLALAFTEAEALAFLFFMAFLALAITEAEALAFTVFIGSPFELIASAFAFIAFWEAPLRKDQNQLEDGRDRQRRLSLNQ